MDLPISLSVFSEFNEVNEIFFHEEVLQTIKTYEDLFIRMHFSDQSVISQKL